MAKHQVCLAPGRSLFFIPEIGLDLTPWRPMGFVPDDATESVLRMIKNSLESKDLIDVKGTLTRVLAGEKIVEVEKTEKAVRPVKLPKAPQEDKEPEKELEQDPEKEPKTTQDKE